MQRVLSTVAERTIAPPPISPPAGRLSPAHQRVGADEAQPIFMSLHVCGWSMRRPAPFAFVRRNREISRLKQGTSPRRPRWRVTLFHRAPGAEFAEPARVRRVANIAPERNVPNAATKPAVAGSWSGSFTMLNRPPWWAPEQHTSITNDRITRPQIVPGRVDPGARRARSRCHHDLAIPSIDEAPPTVRAPDRGACAIIWPIAVAECDTRCDRDREGDPVAQARRELRSEQLQEPRHTKHATAPTELDVVAV